MKPLSRPDLDLILKALANPTRRAMLARLAEGDAHVTELTESHDMSLAAISKHLHVLIGAGLIRQIKEGRNIRCRFSAEPLGEVFLWLQPYLNDSRKGSISPYGAGWESVL